MFMCRWVLNWCGCFEVCTRNEKNGENELDDDFGTNWYFNPLFVVVLNAYLCL